VQEELNTILAALRFYQERGMGDPFKRPSWLQEIACPNENDTSLTASGIDSLCESLNCGEIVLYRP
jgi:hypothetical protein